MRHVQRGTRTRRCDKLVVLCDGRVVDEGIGDHFDLVDIL
jgi:hypothetical protein